jgi:hypothetical protein
LRWFQLCCLIFLSFKPITFLLSIASLNVTNNHKHSLSYSFFSLFCYANLVLVTDVTASNKMFITLHPMQQSASYAAVCFLCTFINFMYNNKFWLTSSCNIIEPWIIQLVIIGQLFIFYRICHFNPSIELVLCRRNCIKRGNFSAYDIRVIFGMWKEKPVPLSVPLPIFHFT